MKWWPIHVLKSCPYVRVALCGLCTQRLVGRAGSEGSSSQVFLQGEVAACDLVGGEAGVLLTVAKARCELGYHLGSVVVTTLWWGRYDRGLRTWTCTSDLAPLSLVELLLLQGAVPKEGLKPCGFWWVCLGSPGRPVTANSGFQSAVSALWLRAIKPVYALFQEQSLSDFLPSGEPHWS